MNDPEQRLSDSLVRAADRYDERDARPIGLDRVVREARSIRRRRTTAVVLASAAAVAVIAPVAVIAGGRLGSHGQGPIDEPSATPSTSVSPSASPTPSATPSASPTKLDLASISRGADPRIGYVLDHTVHEGGSTSTLPASIGRVAAFTSYHGGWLVADDDTNKGVQLDNTGAVVRAVGTDFRTSADGVETAFACCNGQVHVGTAMADSETSYPIANPGQIVGFLSGGRVVYDDGSGPGSVRVLGKTGAKFKDLWGASDANESTNLVAGQVGSKGMSEVVSADSGRTLWSTDQWRLLRFSPNGAYVSATPSAGNGDPTQVAVLDATNGQVVTRFRFTGRGLALQYDPAWESDDALAMATYQSAGRAQAILRLSADGTVDRATDVVPARADGLTWVFTTRP